MKMKKKQGFQLLVQQQQLFLQFFQMMTKGKNW
jgi:hypothetical protein